MKYIDRLYNEEFADYEIKADYHTPKYNDFIPKIDVEQFVSNLDSDLYDILTDLEQITGLSEIDDIRIKVEKLYNDIS